MPRSHKSGGYGLARPEHRDAIQENIGHSSLVPPPKFVIQAARPIQSADDGHS